MAINQERLDLFDRWAADYDASVHADGEDGFPFAGYGRVLDAIVTASIAEVDNPATLHVLDVGIGTGNVAEKFARIGCEVFGVDFSAEMLKQAGSRLPDAQLIQADLLRPLPRELCVPFDRIVSGYVLHEFDLSTKIELLQRLAESSLAPGGLFVIGDVAFPDGQVRAGAHARWRDVWDEDEYYWAADEALTPLRALGWDVRYEQISVCAGIFVLRPQ